MNITSGPMGGRQAHHGTVPIVAAIDYNEMQKDLENAIPKGIYTNNGGMQELFAISDGEIAFERHNVVREYADSISADGRDQHTKPMIRTSLNAFDTSENSLKKLAHYLDEKVKQEAISQVDANEMMRDAILAHVKIVGVTYLDKAGRHLNRSITTHIVGVRNIKGCVTESVRAGRLVEAIPVLPHEYLDLMNSTVGSNYDSGKAQFIIRELTDRTISDRMNRNMFMFLSAYSTMAPFFSGEGKLAMRRFVGAQARTDFAIYSGLQMLGMLTEMGLVDEIAGVSLPRAIGYSPDEKQIFQKLVRRVITTTRDGTPPSDGNAGDVIAGTD